jgi:hypothetical protein
VAEELSQLHQVHLWLLDRQLVGGRGLAGALTQQQLQQCSGAWKEQLQATAADPPSAIQQQVFAALQQLTAAGQLSWQQPPAMEQLAVPDGACLIDIAGVTADGVRLAIEVDGRTHFLWPDRRLDGSSQHRNRMLAVRGYAVIGVPYYEWNRRADTKRQQQQQLRPNSEEQVRYLQQLIHTATQQQRGRVQHNSYHQQQQEQHQQGVQGTHRRQTRISSSQQLQSDISVQQQRVKPTLGAAAAASSPAAAAAAATNRTSPSGRVRRIR